MALGAATALTTEPLFPEDLKSWVAQGQVAVSGFADSTSVGAASSKATERKWTVPAGLITVRDVEPKAPGGCASSECPPRPILSKPTGELKVSLQITPLAVAPDTDYSVVLSARDGHVYDSVKVSWTREDLIGIDPAERSVIKRKASASLHNRRVELEAPYDDVSILPFIEEWNQAVGEAAKAYDLAKSKEMAIDPLAAPIVAALFPGALEPLEQQGPKFDQSEMDRIVNQHFTLELVEARVFSARLPANRSGGSASGKPKR
jgi:hypothetical protein